ncbi:MAG: hypothetical protein JOZ77_05490 [Candidatus Eremiobacteraeota bacterium]|nr:hypothetical protein [Candidatus Eremiobacteraeota bacterium]
MGPVGSSLTSGAPSGEGPPKPAGYRKRALAIVIVILVALCAAIAWSQWYAIHVNVPLYQARDARAHSR